MAVLAAFNCSAVYRMRRTAKELRPAVRQAQAELEKAMNSGGSFKSYRDHVATLAPPAIPYVGLLLTDLTFIDTNANTVDGLVNWTKRAKVSRSFCCLCFAPCCARHANGVGACSPTQMYELIDAVLRFQQPGFNLQEVPQVQGFLSAQPLYSEDDLYRLSIAREPRIEEQRE